MNNKNAAPAIINMMSQDEIERERMNFGKPAVKKKKCCGLCGAHVDELPDIPERNVCGCSVDNLFRKSLIKLTSQTWFDRFFLFVAIVDNVLIIIDGELNLGDWTIFSDIGFASMYTIEVVLKVWAWGMFGGKMSFWNSNVFNRFDVLVAVAAWLEIAAKFLEFDYTIRSIKLYRVLKPLIHFVFFNGLESIMETMELGAVALGTVMYLMIFFFVLFGVVGMELFAGSYNRKCVWADTGEVRMPERYCKRYDEKELLSVEGSYFSPGMSLNNNCGPMQVCQDVGAMNYGFTNYDNMASSLITVFQAFSTDSQAYVMWAGIQSEPEWVVIVLIFYFGIAFALGQTLINVFVAVLTTVFSAVREQAAQRQENEKAEEEDGEQHADVKIGQVVPFDDGDGDKPPSSGGQSGGPVEDVPLANVVDGGVPVEPDDDEANIKPEILPPEAAPKTQKFDFPYLFSKIFRNPVAQAVVLIVIFANAIVICLIGTFPEYNALLVEAEYYFSIFFLVEFLTQVGCDGSLAKYFNHPEHNFDFLVQLSTTSALIAQSAGASPDNTSVLRSLAIMRLFRACKFFFLRPLWLMLIKMVDVSGPPSFTFLSSNSLLHFLLRFHTLCEP